jgi:hypothetical protein
MMAWTRTVSLSSEKTTIPTPPYLSLIYRSYREALAAYEVWGYVGQCLSLRS